MGRVNFLLNAENRLFKMDSGNKKFLYSIPVFPIIFLLFIFLLTVNISYFFFHIKTNLPVFFTVFNFLFVPAFILLFIKYAKSISPAKAADVNNQTETRFKELIESLNYPIVRVNLEGNFVFANETYCKKFGKSENELRGTQFQPLVRPEDLQSSLKKIENLKEPPHRIILEQRADTVDGWRWIEWESDAIFDRNGNFIEIQAIGRDITERKESEAKLHLQEMAIQRTINGVVITDPTQPDNPVIFCNPAYEKITGYKAEEVIGRNPRFLQGIGTDRLTVEKMRNALKKEEECNVTILNYRKDGTPFWNEIRIIPIRSKGGKLVNYLAIKRDITDRMDDERIIKESEIKFRSIVEQSIDGIMLIDEAGVIVEWNYALEKITGISKKDTIGKSITESEFCKAPESENLKESSTRLKNVIIEIIEKRGTKNFNSTIDDEIMLKNGEIKSLQSIVYPIITDRGIMIGTVIRDITQRKSIEKQNIILNRAIESSASGVVLFDLNFSVQYVNASIIQMMNVSADIELKGRVIFDFISDNDIEVVKNKYIPLLLKNEEWFGEIELKNLNGDLINSEVNCSFVKNNDNYPIYILAIINDITERKKHELAIKESEQRYRLVVDNIKEIIFKTDAAGNLGIPKPGLGRNNGVFEGRKHRKVIS